MRDAERRFWILACRWSFCALQANDLDIICRGAAWEKVKSIGTLKHNDEYDVAIVALHDGKLSLGNKWGIGNFDIDDLIDGAESIDELPFVQIKHVVQYKLERGSSKDLLHIESLKQSKYAALVGETD